MLSLVLFIHLNLLKANPERITKADKNMVNDLDYEGIKFTFLKMILVKLKRKSIFALMSFVMKIVWLILFTYNMKIFKIVWIYC